MATSGPGRLGTPSPALGLPATGGRAGSPARNISRADTFMTRGRSHSTGRCALLPLPSLSSHARPPARAPARPRLPLGVRRAHIFPSAARPGGPRQVRKANKSPARAPCIYQSGGLSSSRLDPHESRPQRGGGGRIWPRAAPDTWWERVGAPRCSQLRGAGRFTPLPPARASSRFEVPPVPGWGWGCQASSLFFSIIIPPLLHRR